MKTIISTKNDQYNTSIISFRSDEAAALTVAQREAEGYTVTSRDMAVGENIPADSEEPG